MTLLTPAVLHSSALEHIKDESPKFHRKYVVHFAFMQGIWGVILYLICFSFILIPKAAYIRETGEKILLNANFSTVTIKGNTLSVDIKPSIWAFTIGDSTRTRDEFVIDSTGKLNRFYWDDRVEKGELKQFNGVGVTKDWLFMKSGSHIKKIQYSKLTMGKDVQITKSDLHAFLLKNTDKSRLLKMGLLMAPLVFIVSALMGALLHGVYILVVGTFLAIITKRLTRTATQCYNVASGLYVGWSYVMVLSLIAHKIVFLTFGNISNFILAINVLAFAGVVLVGYLFFQSKEDGYHKPAITKVNRKSR